MAVSVPDAMRDLFNEPALGHVSYTNAAGQIVTFPMWVDYDGARLLTSSPVGIEIDRLANSGTWGP